MSYIAICKVITTNRAEANIADIKILFPTVIRKRGLCLTV